jgi:hypothetical protein
MDRPKDPERQRLGRLGALTVHAKGRTNTGPATRASMEALAAEFGIGPDLDPAERERRMRLALRVRGTRLAEARWGPRRLDKKPAPVSATIGDGREARRVGVEPVSA